MEKIVIALCTYKREDLLDMALSSVIDLVVPDNYIVNILLVDNADSIASKNIFKKFENKINFECFYVVEENKGITFSRNRALEEASRIKCEYIAFFDDDAIVDKFWLVNLVKFLAEDKKTIVTGPQITIFPKSSPDWAKQIIYFNQKRYESGTNIKWAATNNVLFPINIYNKENICFDNRLRYSGGSDQCFFMEARKNGYDIKWSNDALVYESVPESRVTIDWVKYRSFRYGSTGFFMHNKKEGFFRALIISLFKAVCYSLLGFKSLIFSKSCNELKKIEGICYLYRAMGWISGIFDKKFNEYEKR